MNDPDEFYIPDDGDPWQQQQQELEQQEVDNSVLVSEIASEEKTDTDAAGSHAVPPDSGDPF
jgi:hypothetical protein